ncbi:hypothetical protein ACLKA7_016631 [Drosophila subpalustris]
MWADDVASSIKRKCLLMPIRQKLELEEAEGAGGATGAEIWVENEMGQTDFQIERPSEVNPGASSDMTMNTVAASLWHFNGHLILFMFNGRACGSCRLWLLASTWRLQLELELE